MVSVYSPVEETSLPKGLQRIWYLLEVGTGQKSGTDPGRIHYPDLSRLGIFVPGHLGTVCTAYYLQWKHTKAILIYVFCTFIHTHGIRHGSTRIRLVQGDIPELSVPARFYCRDPPPLIFTNHIQHLPAEQHIFSLLFTYLRTPKYILLD